MEHRVKVSVGLDFGTYQTKVCVRFSRAAGAPIEYHFVPLTDAHDELDALFLPSMVSVHQSGSIVYGSESNNSNWHTYTFFKIASAEDEEFLTDLDQKESKYGKSEFAPYTPEFLSIIYLAHVIHTVKTHVTTKLFTDENSKKAGSFIDRYRRSTTERVFEWEIQMGVPTEYQLTHNIYRRRKFEHLLYVANELVDRTTIVSYSQLGVVDLKKHVQQILDLLEQHVRNRPNREIQESEWARLLGEKRLSVFPETAAGLAFLVRSGKVERGKHYMSIDIGGGSTDISFFEVTMDRRFRYLASKSIMVASNDILRGYLGAEADDMMTIRNSIEELLADRYAGLNNRYTSSYREVMRKIHDKAYKMFNSEVYKRVLDGTATTVYSEENTRCIIYGGGVCLPEIHLDSYRVEILLHDNGVKGALFVSSTYAPIFSMGSITYNESIKPSNWTSKIDFLVVALGLSLAMDRDTQTSIEEDFYPRPEATSAVGEFDFRRARWV